PASVSPPEPPSPGPSLDPDPGPDLAALKRALAPPLPEDLALADLDAVLAAYDLGTYPGDWETQAPLHRPYLAVHWRRYLATLALARPLAPRRAIDLGVVPPLVFQALLAAELPGIAIDGVWAEARAVSQLVRARVPGHQDLPITLHPADVERDPLPFADGSADLVLAMEILEHLAVDPAHALVEAARVLVDGGHLILSTPNAASHRGVAKILRGAAPQSFGLFVPVGGAHGRHCREYAPGEVRALAEAAGFETLRLFTADPYDDAIEPDVARLLAARGEDLALRGETIFYLGRKAGPPGPPPDGIYHGVPERLAGRLSVRSRGADGAVIRAENTSRADWPVEGVFATSLWLEWSDARGRLVHRGGRRALPAPVPAGGAVDIALAIGPGGDGTLTVQLFQDAAGPFRGAGRADPVSLPASEADFLSLSQG
ncbi:MAG: class I SAM-dependent methyltransferase, partial [Paracoccaceae bacterium]